MRRAIPFYFGLATLFTVAAPAARAAGGAAAQAPAPPAPEDRRLDEARAARRQVLAGDLSALDRAQAGFERLVRAAPGDPLPTAYLSSLLAIRAWHAAGPTQAEELAVRAVGLADRALGLETRATGGRRAQPAEELRRTASFAYLTVARLQLLEAQLGDSAALPRAEALFTRTAELSPDDPLPLAYRGAVLALRIAAEGSERERGALAERSLALLDRALAMAGAPGGAAPDREPSSAEARIVAAGTFIGLPDPLFHRFDRGLALLRAELDSAALNHLPPRLRAHLQYQAALAARRQGRSADEVAHLRAYVELAPDGDPLAPTVRTRLAEVEP